MIRRLAILGFVLALLAWVGLLLWASTERLHVVVTADGGSLVGTVGAATVQTTAGGMNAGQVGFFLQGADPHATIPWPADGAEHLSSQPSLDALLYRLGAETAWSNVRITNLDTGQVIDASPDGGTGWRPFFGDWFTDPLGGQTTATPGLALVGSPDWRNYRIDADVLRPRAPVGILVRAADGSNGALFFFRVEDRDAMWFSVQNGTWLGPSASAPYRILVKDPVSGTQDVIRLLLGGLPGGLVFLGVILAASSLERRVRAAIVAPTNDALRRNAEHPPPPSRLGESDPLSFWERVRGRVEGARRKSSPTERDFPHPNPHSKGEGMRNRLPVDVLSAVERYRLLAQPPAIGLNGRSQLDRPGASGGLAALAGAADVGPPNTAAMVVPETSAAPDVRAAAAPDLLPTTRPGTPSTVATWVVVGLIVATGLALTLNVADALLQRMPHVQDSVAYLFQAKTYALGRPWVPTPPHPDFFVHEFIIMSPDGRWFGKYPPGWPLLLALGVLAGAPWVIDPICGALCLLMLFLIGRDVYGVRVGLLAAAIGLSAPFWIFLSGSMMSHTSGLLFILLGVYGLWHAGRGGQALWPAIVAGVAFGVALNIRPYTALVVVVPFALYVLARVARDPLDGLKRYAPALVAILPFVAAFFIYNRVMTGNPLLPPQELWWKWDKVGFGPDKGIWGYYPVDALVNTSRNLSELLTHGFGWPPFLTLALASVPFLARRARTWDWLFLFGFLAVVVGYAFWWADGIMYGPRFYFEGFGFLILLTARGVDVGLELAAGRGEAPWKGYPGVRPPAPLAAFLSVMLLVGLVAYNVTFYLPGQWQLYHGYNYVNHRRLDAVTAAGIHHAVVFANQTNQYAWWDYGMVFSANDPLLQGDVVYARDLGDARDCALRADYPNLSFWKLDGTALSPLTGCPPVAARSVS